MKKLTSSVLSIVLLLTAFTGFAKDYPQKFYDVPKDHWAFEYIAELVDRGAISGYEDGSYLPMNTVTRAEWAKIMVASANKPLGEDTSTFNDMAGHWGNPWVNAAKSFMTTYENGAAFRPDVAALREDVTVALVKLKGFNADNANFSYISNFTDQSSISASCKKYVAVAVEKGLISGFENNTFRGQDTLTRAEAATLLWRASQMGNDDKGIDGQSDTSDSGDNKTSSSTPTTSPTPKPSNEPKKDPENIPDATHETMPTPTTEPAPTETPEPTPEPTPTIDFTQEAVDKIKNGETRNIQFGEYKWRILEVNDERALLITENVVEDRAYHPSGGAVTWEKCSLRAYLNSDFYNNFSESERARIAEVRNINPDNLNYGTLGGKDTFDKIFLLSINEAEYYFETDYDRKIDGRYWHLRSPAEKEGFVARVHSEGQIVDRAVTGTHSTTVTMSYTNRAGVRPALWINLRNK